MLNEEIKIIKFRKQDYPRFLKIQIDSKTSGDFNRSLFGYAIEGFKSIIDRTRIYKFTVLKGEKFAGFASIMNIRNFYELAIYILPEYRKKGIATMVAKRLLDYAFRKLDMKKIMAVVDENKIASKKILKKLGFKFIKRNNREKTLLYEKDIDFKPLMNKGEIKKRWDWQEKVYGELKKQKGVGRINVSGIGVEFKPGVFAPFWGDSSLLAEVLIKVIKKNEKVLDIGTGTGIQAIAAGKNAKNVLAVDINKNAVMCAKENVEKSGLKKIIKVKESDLFSRVRGKFDTIIFNPPFRWFKPRDMLERGEVDEGYKTLRKFLEEAGNFLEQRGRIILVFSDSGDIKYLEKTIGENGFNKNIITQKKLNGWTYFVYELNKIRKNNDK